MPSTVYIRKAANFERETIVLLVEEIFSQLPTIGEIEPTSRVLLKPNLLAKHTPEKAVTTHPDIVYAVIKALQKRGVTNITIADSAGGVYTPAAMEGIYKASGMAAVCEETGAKLYTACKSRPVSSNGKLVHSFELIEPVLDSDIIINLPKFKTHVMTGMTGAVKNLFGCVPGLQKAEFHMRFPEKNLFGQMLVDLCETVKPTVHLVDGLLAMEGDGPAGGAPRPLSLIIAGEDPYAIDLAICRYMGVSPMNIPFLAAAHQNGLCEAEFNTNLFNAAPELQLPIENFILPRSHNNINFDRSVPGFLRPLVPPFVKWISPKPKINKKKCIGCGKCAEICPQHVIEIRDNKAIIGYKNCIRCFCCHEMCPVKAIDVKRNNLFKI